MKSKELNDWMELEIEVRQIMVRIERNKFTNTDSSKEVERLAQIRELKKPLRESLEAKLAKLENIELHEGISQHLQSEATHD